MKITSLSGLDTGSCTNAMGSVDPAWDGSFNENGTPNITSGASINGKAMLIQATSLVSAPTGGYTLTLTAQPKMAQGRGIPLWIGWGASQIGEFVRSGGCCCQLPAKLEVTE